MSRILIWAPNPAGHRLYYVRLLVDGALSLGHEVSVAMVPSADFDLFASIHLSGIDSRIAFHPIESVHIGDALGAAKETQSDMMIDPDGDALAKAILMTRRRSSHASILLLIMRPTGQRNGVPGYGLFASILKFSARKVLSRFRGVTVLTLASATAGNVKPGTAPDPVSFIATSASADRFRASHKMTPDRHWFAVIGALDSRKNIAMVATALQQLGPKAGLLLAGRLSNDAEKRSSAALDNLSSSGVALVRINRLLSDQEIDDAVLSADCVFLAHSNEGSSGILGKAAAAGTRVIAAGARSLKKDAGKIPGICTWVPLEVNALARAAVAELGVPSPAPIVFSSQAFVAAFFQTSSFGKKPRPTTNLPQ
jgi:hypothetical protein